MSFDSFLGCMSAIVGVFLIFAFSWAIVAALVWLISMCFGFEFSLLLATGVWLVAMLVRFTLNGTK